MHQEHIMTNHKALRSIERELIHLCPMTVILVFYIEKVAWPVDFFCGLNRSILEQKRAILEGLLLVPIGLHLKVLCHW